MKPVHLVIVVLYLFLGTVVSLSQSWWAIYFHENIRSSSWRPRALQYPYLQGGYNPSTTGLLNGAPNTEGDAWLVVGVKNRTGRVFQVQRYISGAIGVEEYLEPDSIPSWSRAFLPPSNEDVEQRVYVLEQVNGWPFLSWRGDYKTDGHFLTAQHSNCFPDDRSVGINAWYGLILFPYEPVFPGILYNAIFFGGFIFIAVRTVKHTRRRITEHVRLNRHQCTKCKYDITGLTTCPECGRPVTTKAFNKELMDE